MNTTDALLLALNVQLAVLIGVVAEIDPGPLVGPALLLPLIYLLVRRLTSADSAGDRRV